MTCDSDFSYLPAYVCVVFTLLTTEQNAAVQSVIMFEHVEMKEAKARTGSTMEQIAYSRGCTRSRQPFRKERRLVPWGWFPGRGIAPAAVLVRPIIGEVPNRGILFSSGTPASHNTRRLRRHYIRQGVLGHRTATTTSSQHGNGIHGG